MNWLSKAWDAVNGHKTTLGAVIYFAGRGLVFVGEASGEIIVELGSYLMGIGLLHKGKKVNDARKNGKS